MRGDGIEISFEAPVWYLLDWAIVSEKERFECFGMLKIPVKRFFVGYRKINAVSTINHSMLSNIPYSTGCEEDTRDCQVVQQNERLRFHSS